MKHFNYECILIKGRKRPIHRILMEKKLGRKLKPWEVVHHIDGDKTNNAYSNLLLMSLEEHTSLHHAGRRYKKNSL